MKQFHIQRSIRFLAIASVAIFISGIFPAAGEAKEVLFGKPWSYNVRNSTTAASKAMMRWQVDRASGSALGGTAAGAGAGVPGAGATANYSAITVILDDGSVGHVQIGTDQDSMGNQTATSLTAVGQEGPVNVQATP